MGRPQRRMIGQSEVVPDPDDDNVISHGQGASVVGVSRGQLGCLAGRARLFTGRRDSQRGLKLQAERSIDAVGSSTQPAI